MDIKIADHDCKGEDCPCNGSIEDMGDKRTVYYVWYATDEEAQHLIYHRSNPYDSLADAKFGASLKAISNDKVYVEQRDEVKADDEWQTEGEPKTVYRITKTIA